MRGATKATAGSQKWPSNASSQPRRGSTSESRKATKSVAHTARPVLRAAAGPLLRGWRSTCDVAVHAREVRLLDRGCRAVVHHHDTHAAQRRNQPMYSRSVVTHRDNDRNVTMRRPAGRPRMGDCGVEERAGDLRAERVVHLEPAAGEHGLGSGRKPQQPGGGTAEQSRPLAEHLDSAINLHGEAVGQPGLTHVSIPSRSGVQRAIRPTHPSTISANRRAPSVAVAVVGSPEYAQFTHRRHPAAAHRRQQLGQRSAVSRHPLVGPHVVRRNM